MYSMYGRLGAWVGRVYCMYASCLSTALTLGWDRREGVVLRQPLLYKQTREAVM
jgi:hypothetical protein